jgi:hypothetical protein
MTKRSEQSRGHGHRDSSWTSRLHAVSERPLPLDAPEEPNGTRPTLTLVGGTDVTPKDLDPIATVGT